MGRDEEIDPDDVPEMTSLDTPTTLEFSENEQPLKVKADSAAEDVDGN